MSKLASRSRGGPGGVRRGARPPGTKTAAASAKEALEREKLRKNNRLCTSVIVIFGVCWLPLNVINFLMDVRGDLLLCWKYHHAVFFACHVVAMTSNCYNAFLYGWLNDAFREEFLKMMPFLATVCGGGGNVAGDSNGAAAGANNRKTTIIQTRSNPKSSPAKMAVTATADGTTTALLAKEENANSNGELKQLIANDSKKNGEENNDIKVGGGITLNNDIVATV